MFNKLFINASIMVLSSIAFAGQNIATNSNGCGEVTITGNSVQSVIMDGQTISNSNMRMNTSNNQSTSMQAGAVSEADVTALQAEIVSKMKLFEQKKAQYDATLAEFKSTGSKNKRLARSLAKQSNYLKALEIQIDQLTQQYDAQTSDDPQI